MPGIKMTELKSDVKKKSVVAAKNDEIELIRAIAAPGATESELQHFLYVCKEYNLDPLKKEIFFLKYSGKSTIITSRDGYLKIANLSSQFDGLESDVVYHGDKLTKRDDGSVHIEYGPHHMVFDKTKLIGAFCSVFRKDRSKATMVFVSIKDYYKKGAPIWEQYINAMILKVAEAMALKRAFAISGLVTKEEIEKEGFDADMDVQQHDEHVATDAQKKAISVIISSKGIEEDHLKVLLHKQFNKEHYKELTKEEASQLISILNGQSA